MEGSCAVFTVVTTKVSDDRYSYRKQHFVTFGLFQGLAVVYAEREGCYNIALHNYEPRVVCHFA
jgi:hypothetical protein